MRMYTYNIYIIYKYTFGYNYKRVFDQKCIVAIGLRFQRLDILFWISVRIKQLYKNKSGENQTKELDREDWF